MSHLFRTFIMSGLLALSSAAFAEDAQRTKSAADKPDSEIARYCAAVAPSAAEARLNFNLKRLKEIEARLNDEMAALKELKSSAQDWVSRREALMKAATEDVVTIYSKMAPDAAATQIATMDDAMAASILTKLKPQAAGAILNEMDGDRAAHLTTLMSGAAAEDKGT